MTTASATVGGRVADRMDGLVALSRELHAHPETAFEEHLAARLLLDALDGEGFEVEAGVCDLPTAFAARVGTGPLVLALCAEYDALPGIGHACGHNLIAATTLGAAAAVAPLVDELDCTVVVLGTPAEERGAGKALMLERGAFDGVHAALMVHPGPFDVGHPATVAMAELSVRATGTAAHAGAAPHLGVNAADAMVVAQTAIGLLRQHLAPGDMVHGIVTSAGVAPNVIPDSATADYVVRARTAERLRSVESRVRRCFEAGGVATGAEVEVAVSGRRVRELTSDTDVLAAWVANLRGLGRRPAPGPPVPISTDMGNVSAVIPSIHPIIGIGSWPAVNHQPAFADATLRAPAQAAVHDAAVATAATVVDLATDPALRRHLLTTTRPGPQGGTT